MNENTENTGIAIYRFMEEQLELFKDLMTRTKTTIDEETIHQMRVAVKKIRTIQKLKKHINFPSLIKKPQFKTIKEIFAISGQLRDLQIQQNLLEAYRKKLKFSYQQLSEYLDKQQKVFEEELYQKIRETDFVDFPDMQENEVIDDENDLPDIENESVDFLKLKINTINRLIFTLDRNDHIHDLRKELKQLFFVLQFLKKHFAESNAGEIELKRLRKITDRLGHWNDRDVFDSMLQDFINAQGESFLLENPEYTILQYVLRSEKTAFLLGIEVDVYLELINLKAMIQKAN